MTAIRVRVLFSTVCSRGGMVVRSGQSAVVSPTPGKGRQAAASDRSHLDGNSLMVMLEQYTPNLKQMKAIRMNVGTQDGLLQTNRDMDQALTRAGVAHTFETFEGDHNGQVRLNFETKVLPFFSQQLSFGER